MKRPVKVQQMSSLTLKLSLVTLSLVLYPGLHFSAVLILPDPAQKFTENE